MQCFGTYLQYDENCHCPSRMSKSRGNSLGTPIHLVMIALLSSERTSINQLSHQPCAHNYPVVEYLSYALFDLRIAFSSASIKHPPSHVLLSHDHSCHSSTICANAPRLAFFQPRPKPGSSLNSFSQERLQSSFGHQLCYLSQSCLVCSRNG